jgi:superfamily II DNA or RNA helicase
MRMISHFFEHGFNKMSLKFETGAGKTTLALLLILQTGLKKVKSFVINHSFDLCFRDYNKLVPIAH